MLLIYTDESQMERATEEMLSLVAEGHRAVQEEARRVSLPAADLKAGMLAEGVPEAIADRMLDLERYFREDRASAITDDVTRLTGRASRRFANYVRDTARCVECGRRLSGDLNSLRRKTAASLDHAKGFSSALGP